MRLLPLPETFAVCRLAPGEPWHWAEPSRGLLCVARTGEELSVTCEERLVPAGVRAETGWRALRVAGTLDFSLTGVLAALTAPLAAAGVSVFAVSTFDTDYLLVRQAAWSRAVDELRAAGFDVAAG